MDASGENLSWRHDQKAGLLPVSQTTSGLPNTLRTSQDLTRGDTGPNELMS